MNWKLKGAVQGVLSTIPGGIQINSVLQRAAGNLRNFSANIDKKVTADWLVLLSHMHEVGISPQGLDYLEVGTGWYPTLPICYYLAGAKSCRTYDIQRHLNARLTKKMLCRLERHLSAIAQAAGMRLETVQSNYDRLVRCNTLKELLEQARIEYIAPGDACCTSLPPGSIDVVFSNSVLEHVPADIIRKLMSESYRVLRPGGFVIHSVNCGDHYAYSDRNITAMNYLLYSEEQWKTWNNPLQYQNRLRPDDFLAMAREAGFHIVLTRQQPQQKLLEVIESMDIAPEFRQYSAEQLATTSIDFLATAENSSKAN